MAQISYVTYGANDVTERKIKDRTVLFIDNDVAQQVLTIEDCMRMVEDAYREFGLGRATASRSLHQIPQHGGNGWFNFAPMFSGISEFGVLAIRMFTSISVPGASGSSYSVTPGKYCELILLYSTEDGALLSIMQGGHIQHMRVGVTGGLSAKYMARPESSVLGIFGSAGMASTHAWAITRVRPIKKIKVYSPNSNHREQFARQMSQDMNIDVVAVDEPKDVMIGSDIVAACSGSTVPVVRSEWLEPGMHVLAVSATEIEDNVLRRCDEYVYSRPPYTDHQVAVPPDEIPDSLPMKGYLRDHWVDRETRLLPGEKIKFLSDVILGRTAGRAGGTEITCFVSHGIPIQFAAAATKVHQLARERGLGRELPLSWFLQDIRH
jgi:ornithine cyclodeaminase/alanine dehydrogenase-like protein (mu-crystallin family)